MAQGIPLGPYVLSERIATGGMGEVYLALRKGLGRFEKPLAIKLLMPHLAEDQRAVQSFVEEAQLSARMSHPNIAQVFDVGVFDKRYFLAMELVRGVSLSRLSTALKGAGLTFSPAVLAYVGRCLCDGLHHAHELKESGALLEVVHRDVTPHNVLVSVDGEVKLTDFGIAKARDSSNSTQPGFIKGKLGYIAPEQARGEKIDRRADIYSAGITLFTLATGFAPFLRDGDLATLNAVVSEPLPSLASLRPDLPQAWIEAVQKAVEKSADRRFETAREFRDALPLPSHQQCAEQLGQLVRTLCADETKALEEKSAHAFAIVEGTLDLVEAQAPTVQGRPPAAPAKRRWVPASLGLAAVGGAAMWLALDWRATNDKPVPPVVQPLAVAEAVDAGPPVGAPVQAPPVEPNPPVEPAAPIAAAAPKKNGFVTIEADPWAQVYLKGALIGETPLSRYPLPAGNAVLTLKNPETGRSVKKTVVIRPGAETKVRGSMR